MNGRAIGTIRKEWGAYVRKVPGEFTSKSRGFAEEEHESRNLVLHLVSRSQQSRNLVEKERVRRSGPCVFKFLGIYLLYT